MSERTRQWLAAHPYWTLALVTIAAFLPFLAKPFNIDDPLFLWTAQQIHTHPGDPYGFLVDWDTTATPMWKITENPPLACYYLALATAILGWSEMAVHTAMLLPAIAVVLGTYRLAKNYCRHPLFAALIALFTPVFLISANTAMCDVSMLAFWVWAVVLWLEGLPANTVWKLVLAGVFIGLAALTKYYGACLLPLLGAYALVQRRPLTRWAQYLLVPLAILVAYQYATSAYGGLFYRAMDYATFSKGFFGVSKLQGILCGLAFTGGCLAPILFFGPILSRKPAFIFFGVLAVVVALIVFGDGQLWKNYGNIPAACWPWIKAQLTVWILAGLGLLALSLWNLWRQRDANSLLLLLWVAGTFYFAIFCNWTVNARSILPMTPAVAILIAQQLERNRHRALTDLSKGAWFALALCAIFALLTESADFSAAVAVRTSAGQVLEKYASASGTLWYEGHWGFQYYMNRAGASAMDYEHPGLRPGDHVVVPANNTNLQPPDPQLSDLTDTFTVPVSSPLSTFNTWTGAGFYAASMGPLPFTFGSVPAEIVRVYYLKPITPSTKPALP